MTRSTQIAAIPLLALLMPFLASLQGCTYGGSTRLVSLDQSGKLEPHLPTLVYTPSGDTGADVYLTNLPRDALARGADLTGVSGHLIHVNMFLTPRPGRTPIDAAASNASIRWIVIADGEVGIYTGGGFVLPSAPPGNSSFGATVKRASLEIGIHTARFVDPLGPSRMQASFRAPRDESLARHLAARFDEINALIDAPR
jgi:hypothetical protein